MPTADDLLKGWLRDRADRSGNHSHHFPITGEGRPSSERDAWGCNSCGIGWPCLTTQTIRYFIDPRIAEAQAFEERYARDSNLTVEVLHQYGRFAEPCDCDYSECEGWRMGHQWEEAIFGDAERERRAARR